MQYKISDGITQSLLTAFMACPKKCAFILKGLYDPSKSENYRKGSIGHAILETIYGSGDWVKTLDEQYEKCRKESIPDEKLNSIFGIFEAIITCYLEFYKKDFKGTKFITEQIFNIEYKGFRLRGKTDLTFQMEKQAVLMEHKFWSQISEDKLINVLSLDFQTNFYAFIYRLQNGKYPDRIDYNVVRIPQNKIKDAESSKDFAQRLMIDIRKDPKYYFRRVPIVPSKRQLESFEKNLDLLLENFKAFTLSPFATSNYMSCYPGIFLCDFAPVCVSGSIAGFKTKPLFEELK